MNNILDSLERKILQKWPSELDGHLHYCIGLSGGIDSVVLFHILSKLAVIKSLTLSAIHVNHGISSNSNSWEEFCINLCNQKNIPLTVAKLAVKKVPGEGLENSARKLRYKEYEKIGLPIILAHHQNDQIETMLSQLVRGSDLHNIAGMQPIINRQRQLFWRPLLQYSKQEILDYALRNQLSHIEDESNYDNHYLRNYLRNEIIPSLIKHDKNIITKLNSSLNSIQQNIQLIDEVAALDLNDCQNEKKYINLSKFKLLSERRQINLLAYYIKQSHLPLPSQKQLSEFNYQIINALPDRRPILKLTSSLNLIRQSGNVCIENHRLSRVLSDIYPITKK